MTRQDDGQNQSIVMTIRLLEELAAASRPQGVTELAKALGEQKARVHRHLATLKAAGVVAQEQVGDRYRLGWKILQLGMSAAEDLELQVLAKRHLIGLRDAVGETVMLAIPANGDALVIDCEPSRAQVTTIVRKGVLFVANTSSLGRTMLAFAAEEVQEAILARAMTRYTDHSIAEPGVLRRRLAQIRERFFDVAVNENIYGVSALAAPVFDQRNAIVGAIGLVGSPFVIKAPPSTELLEPLQDAAQSLSEDMNSTAWGTWRARRKRRI